MTANLDKIKEKIRALKALAENEAATQGEVEAAMNLAQKLCHQYMLDLSEITDDRVIEKELEVNVLIRILRDFKVKRITVMDSAICRLFDCDMLYNEYSMDEKIIGTETDRQTADYCIDFAHNSMHSCWNKYKRTQEYALLRSSFKAKQLKRDFTLGFIDGVCTKCRELKDGQSDVVLKTTGTSLVVVKSGAIEAFKNKTYGQINITKYRKLSVHSDRSLQAGKASGKSIEFTRPITGEKSKCQALPN